MKAQLILRMQRTPLISNVWVKIPSILRLPRQIFEYRIMIVAGLIFFFSFWNHALSSGYSVPDLTLCKVCGGEEITGLLLSRLLA